MVDLGYNRLGAYRNRNNGLLSYLQAGGLQDWLKVLAIDWGTKKIGLALGDTSLKLAIPLKPLANREGVYSSILSIIQEYGVNLVLLGLPLTPSGKEGQRALEVRKFAKELESMLPEGVSLDFWDEKYTTEEALRLVEDVRKKKELKDSLSAYVMLIEFFDSL
jgi:Predicted endonuclease involved in recombination (possible Holliday junction resolvase in Mycoplasmas and B. subtilis)